MATPILFRSHYHITSDPSYAELTVDLYAEHQRASHWDIELRWQANTSQNSTNYGQWYGFRYEIESSRLETAETALRLLRRIQGRGDKALRYCADLDPLEVVRRLRELRSVEVVYDPRVSELVPLAEVMPADVHAWRDDWETMRRHGCTVGCLARSVAEAQAGIASELAKYPRYEPYLLEWLAAGRPVIDITVRGYGSYRIPETETLVERIARQQPVPVEFGQITLGDLVAA